MTLLRRRLNFITKMKKIHAAITATGKYVPEHILTNKELESMIDTTDEWITTRTGIKERRILKDPSKGSSFLAINAAKNLLEKSNLDPLEIDVIILCTATPDMPVAITGAYVASEIGAKNAFSYDLQAACSSFLYGLSTATAYIETSRYKKILLIGADKMSSIVDYTDRTSCIIFGDGAGAVLVEPKLDGCGFQNEYLRSDGIGRQFLSIEAGGSLFPTSLETLNNKQHYLKQKGKAVFKYAVSNMSKSISNVLQKNNLNVEDIDWLVPHQANKRIIDSISSFFKMDIENVMINIQKYGNTTSATIPLLLADYEHKIKKDQKLILTSFGGGFTWGAIYLTWAYNFNN